VYTSAGVPVATAGEKTAVQVVDANAKGSPDVGGDPDASTGDVKSHVVVVVPMPFIVPVAACGDRNMRTLVPFLRLPLAARGCWQLSNHIKIVK